MAKYRVECESCPNVQESRRMILTVDNKYVCCERCLEMYEEWRKEIEGLDEVLSNG